MNKHNRSVFISYSSMDGTDNPLNLQNSLHTKGIDAFCDVEREPVINSRPILDALKREINQRSTFILLFTTESAKRLIAYGKSSKDEQERKWNYTYIELRTAQEYHKNIIPVCTEPCEDDTDIKKLMQELFCECFSRSDSYSYIYFGKGQKLHNKYKEIFDRVGAEEHIFHPDLSKIYWVGTRLSDMPILNNGLGFKGSISLFGPQNDEQHYVMCDSYSNKRVDHNDPTDVEQDEFLVDSVGKCLEKDPDAKFMFYNPSTVYRLNLAQIYGEKHFICLNAEDVLAKVNNKRCFRDMVKDIVPLIPVLERNRADCDYDDLLAAKLRGEFDDRNQYETELCPINNDADVKFIVQAPVSSGGGGTFILTRENTSAIMAALDRSSQYLVSVYYAQNIPVNMHAVIYPHAIVYTPASVQLMREVAQESKLLYKGADFVAYRKIESGLREAFESQVKKVAKRLQAIGYRGVCGIDGIIHDGRVNLMEVNGRFQASTELINRTLQVNGMQTIQEMNFEAFYGNDVSNGGLIDPHFCVNFSNYTYSYEGQSMHDAHIIAMAKKSPNVVDVQSDGYIANATSTYIPQAYLFRLVFRKNIASVSEDGAVLIHENICSPDKWLVRNIRNRDKLVVKIALLIQGIRIKESIQANLREATNNAVDLQIGSGENLIIINSPTSIRYVEFSPFSLHHSNTYPGKFCIYYYGKPLIDDVGIFPADKNQANHLADNTHSFAEIAYLSTDRLRVHLTNACCFKLQGRDKSQGGEGCQFCNIEVNNNPNEIRPRDIQEVVEQYIADRNQIVSQYSSNERPVMLRHFLLGGQSRADCDNVMIETAKVLKKYRLPIYAMTLPLKEHMVRTLVQHEVLEYAYNIEIFNERCRKKYMPGKSRYSVDQYMNALIMTRGILDGVNRAENLRVVRSMIIVGLEPYKDMLEGIQKLIDNNIEPMLSIFRPLPGTPLEDLNAPTIRSVCELFYFVSRKLFEASENRGDDFRKLGPECTCCQNNTVSLPWNLQVGSEVRRTWAILKNKDRFEE